MKENPLIAKDEDVKMEDSNKVQKKQYEIYKDLNIDNSLVEDVGCNVTGQVRIKSIWLISIIYINQFLIDYYLIIIIYNNIINSTTLLLFLLIWVEMLILVNKIN